jgi:hypothetical protein
MTVVVVTLIAILVVTCTSFLFLNPLKTYRIKLMAQGFGQNNQATKPQHQSETPGVIVPSMGNNRTAITDKFMMIYTCKLCTGRNAQMV